MNAAHQRIVARGGFRIRGKRTDPVQQLAAEILRHGDGEAFLKAVRRGRPTARQNIRYQLLREIEDAIGPAIPRRREDRNTPEALRRLEKFHLEDDPRDLINGRPDGTNGDGM